MKKKEKGGNQIKTIQIKIYRRIIKNQLYKKYQFKIKKKTTKFKINKLIQACLIFCFKRSD